MIMLFIGILLWSGVHYIPSLNPPLKDWLVGKMGNGYRGVFSLLIVASIVLMALGWRSMEPEVLYDPIPAGPGLTGSLMMISIYLFAAAHGPSNVKRFIRHPMLVGVIVWGIAHLISNGDDRSVLLFGGMAIWAIVEIFAINRRDGDYEIPDKAPMKKDFIKVIAAIVVYCVLVFLHPYFTGMPAMVSPV